MQNYDQGCKYIQRLGGVVMKRLHIVSSLVIASLLLLNFGCSSKKSDSVQQQQASGQVTLSGTVATGAPVSGAQITLRDSKGIVTTVTTGATGTYSITMTGTAPWVLQVPKPGGGNMYSYAAISGTANIHPLTDPIMRTWFKVQGLDIDSAFSNYGSSTSVPVPSETEVNIIKAVVQEVVQDLLKAAGVSNPAAFDLINTPFTASSSDPQGFDKVIHDTTINSSGAAISVTVVPDSALETAVLQNGGSTSAVIDSNAISLVADTIAPEKPTGLTGIAVSSTQVLLSWSMSSSTDVMGYKVYQNGVEAATVTSTVCVVPKLSASTAYTFTVKAFDSSKNLSDASDAAEVTTLIAASDITPPAAPTGLNSFTRFTGAAEKTLRVVVARFRFHDSNADLLVFVITGRPCSRGRTCQPQPEPFRAILDWPDAIGFRQKIHQPVN